jgi:hypothetical protein
MGDVDAGQALAEAAHPFSEGVGLIVGEQRIDQDCVLRPGDESAAHRRPDRLIARALGRSAGVRAHRRDEHIDRQCTCIHGALPLMAGPVTAQPD